MSRIPGKEQLFKRSLFGGSIECLVPASFVDVSSWRQVPDNQEVFVDMNSNQSLMFDLLEWDEEVPLQHLAVWHFRQLAADNEAETSHLEWQQSIPSTHPSEANGERVGFLAIGTQKITKFYPSSAAGPNSSQSTRRSDNVRIYLGVFRDFRYALDYLIIVNAPYEEALLPTPASLSPTDSTKEDSHLTSKSDSTRESASISMDSDSSSSSDEGAQLPDDLERDRDIFLAICESFKVLNPSLFVQQ